jgi:DNA-binding MarR family transcriptional regulator
MSKQTAEISTLFREVEGKLKQVTRRCFEENGITMPQGMLVGMLLKHGEMKISELSRHMGLTNSTVSGIVDRLEKMNALERVRSQDDKRIVYVRLSPNFAEMSRKFLRIVEGKFEEMLDMGSEEEIAKAIEGLQALKNILDRTKK